MVVGMAALSGWWIMGCGVVPIGFLLDDSCCCCPINSLFGTVVEVGVCV